MVHVICLAILCDLFGMVKWPFSMVKWPPTRGWKGHFESPGEGFVDVAHVLMSFKVETCKKMMGVRSRKAWWKRCDYITSWYGSNLHVSIGFHVYVVGVLPDICSSNQQYGPPQFFAFFRNKVWSFRLVFLFHDQSWGGREQHEVLKSKMTSQDLKKTLQNKVSLDPT